MQRVIVLLLIYLPRKDERLSWPSWLTCSGRFTHIVVTRRLQTEHRTGSVRRPKTGVLPTVLCNQPVTNTLLTTISCELLVVSMFIDDELETGCLMRARFFVTERASRANLLSAAENHASSTAYNF